MPNWESYLKKGTMEWLLEDNNLSLRYFTSIDLLDKKPGSPKVKTAGSGIMTTGMVPNILKKQTKRIRKSIKLKD